MGIPKQKRIAKSLIVDKKIGKSQSFTHTQRLMKKNGFVYPKLENTDPIGSTHRNNFLFFGWVLSIPRVIDLRERVGMCPFLWTKKPSSHKHELGNENSTKIDRAIRTRTVDLLGKTDRTSYFIDCRNDSNCFKSSTCIFFALGSFIN